jgi:hypothetical protein
VKWMPRALIGSHVPTRALTNWTPCGPAEVVGSAVTAVPSAKKEATLGPPGVVTFQTPRIGCLAISAAVSWAAAGCAAAASARPSPPAPSPARAVRRETDWRVVMIDLLLLLLGRID